MKTPDETITTMQECLECGYLVKHHVNGICRVCIARKKWIEESKNENSR